MYLFQDDLIKKRLINPLFISGKYPEVPLMAREILDKEVMFIIKNGQSTEMTDSFIKTEILTLSDVFQKIEREKYPQLWNLTRLISVTPTSTSCEQSFSCLKRRLHENMKKKTAFIFLLTSRNNSVFHL